MPPIALKLSQVAQGHITALEKLIDAYAMIGEAMPRFDRLSAAFKDDKEFSHVMSHFYEDILEFHRRAYISFRRRGESSLFPNSGETLLNVLCQHSLENCIRVFVENLQFAFPRDSGEPQKASRPDRC